MTDRFIRKVNLPDLVWIPIERRNNNTNNEDTMLIKKKTIRNRRAGESIVGNWKGNRNEPLFLVCGRRVVLDVELNKFSESLWILYLGTLRTNKSIAKTCRQEKRIRSHRSFESEINTFFQLHYYWQMIFYLFIINYLFMTRVAINDFKFNTYSLKNNLSIHSTH